MTGWPVEDECDADDEPINPSWIGPDGVMRRDPFYAWREDEVLAMARGADHAEEWTQLWRLDRFSGSDEGRAERDAFLADALAAARGLAGRVVAEPDVPIGRLSAVEAGVLVALLGKLLADPGTDPTIERRPERLAETDGDRAGRVAEAARRHRVRIERQRAAARQPVAGA